jgi:hypothetical protein
MKRAKSRGFLLGELVVVMTLASALTSVYALSSAAVPEIERLCVGSGVVSERRASSDAFSDAKRWVCVAVTGIEPPEYRFASSPAVR